MKTAKKIILHTAKLLGLFKLSKYLTKSDLKIICWHGFSAEDECDWSGGIMMRHETLEKRLTSIVNEYTLMDLNTAVTAFKQKALPDNALVLTIDDGFRGTVTVAHPLFKKYNAPYTIYLTTYYYDKDIQIVNLILQYAVWKTKVSTFTYCKGGIEKKFELLDLKTKKELYLFMFDEIDPLKSLAEKRDALHAFLTGLELDADELLSRGWLKLINAEQLKFLHNDGVDIQLHTHRHRFPDDDEAVIQDLRENAETIKNAIGKECDHFCYPSGEYRLNALDALRVEGVKSSTTCMIGSNKYGADVHLLKRYLDLDSDSQIEFEANISGFTQMIKGLIKKNKK